MGKMNKVLLRSATAVALSFMMAVGLSGGVVKANVTVTTADPSTSNNIEIYETSQPSETTITQTPTGTDLTSGTTSSVLVETHQPTRYTVSLPKMVKIEDGNLIASATTIFDYTVKYDLAQTQELTVTADTVTLYAGIGNISLASTTHQMTPSFSDGVAQYASTQTITGNSAANENTTDLQAKTFKCKLTNGATAIRAGRWRGALNVKVKINQVEADKFSAGSGI